VPNFLATAAFAWVSVVGAEPASSSPLPEPPREETQPLTADAAQAGDAATRPVATPVGDPAPAPMGPAQPTLPAALPEGAVPTESNPAAAQLEQVPRWDWLANPLAPRRAAVKGKRRSPHRFLPLPSLRSQPSVGLMLGASLNYAYRPREEDPNRIYLFVEARVSLRKVQQHGFFVRLRDNLGYREIFEIGFNVMIDPVFPYFGIANHHNLRGDNLQARHYQLKLTTIGGFFTYQHPLWTLKRPGSRPPGTLRSYSGFGYFVDRILPYEGTLFAGERPFDAGVTRRGVLRLGLIWDRRDNDWSPRTGALHDITVDSAGPWTGSTHAWGRLHATFRHYHQLGLPSLVLAHRLTYDGLWGDAPFVTLGEFGGLAVSDAIGGQAVGRGWMRRRFIGRHKAYASVELRFEPIELKIGKHTLGLGIKGYVDLGLVAERLRDLPLHCQVSGGPGILLVWDRFAVIRLDGGFSRELKAFYLMTEHAF
jgi:hypothetical protein